MTVKALGARALSALLCAGFSGTAFAHAHLASAVPAENAIVSVAPALLQLKFSEGLELKFSGLSIVGPGGTKVSMGPVSLAAGDDATLVAPVSGTLAAGTYTVNWRALSRDGHATHGTYTFALKH